MARSSTRPSFSARGAALVLAILAPAAMLGPISAAPAGAAPAAARQAASRRFVEPVRIGRNLPTHADSTLGTAHTIRADIGGLGYGTGTNVSQTDAAVASYGPTDYVSDSGHNVIRALVSATGQETVFAGNGTCGYTGDGGPAASAELCGPGALAVDGDGNLYIADSNNGVIRMVAAVSGTYFGVAETAGDIYTIAGGGTGGSGSPALSANMNGVSGLAVDPSGNLIIAGGGTVEAVAATSGDFYGTTMTAGDFYVVTTPPGPYYDRVATVAAGPSGTLFATVFDGAVYQVDQVGSDGSFTTVAGGAGVGPATTVGIQETDLAVTSSTLDISDGNIGELRSVDLATAEETPLNGTGSFGTPWDMTTDAAGNVYYLSGSPYGETLVSMVPAVSGTYYGQQVAAGQSLIIFESDVETGGLYLTQACAAPINGIAVDSAGNLYYSSSLGGSFNDVDQVCELPARDMPYNWGGFFDGTIDSYPVAGDGSFGFGGDGGPAGSAAFNFAGPLAVVPGGIVVGDEGNNRVRFVALQSGTFYGQTMSQGDIYTIAGDGTGGDTGDGGLATSASLDGVAQLTTDAAGDVFVTDQTTNTVRVVAAQPADLFGQSLGAGEISTVAGDGQPGTPVPGSLATSGGLIPGTVTAAPGGDLYFTTAYQVYSVSASDDVVSLVAGDGDPYQTISGVPALDGELYPGAMGVDPAGNLAMPGRSGGLDVLAEQSGTDDGVAMTAGNLYEIAGGQPGSNTGSSAGIDAEGDTFSSAGNVLSEYVATPATVDGQPEPAGAVLDVAGNGHTQYSGDGAAAGGAELSTSTEIDACPGGGGSNDAPRVPRPASSGGGGGSGSCTVPTGGTAVDAAGDVAIADGGNNVVRFVPAVSGTYFGTAMTGGDIYTIAGGGFAGMPTTSGTPAQSATLNSPSNVAFDSYGNLYIADTGDDAVEMMPVGATTPFGSGLTVGDVYTLVGNGKSGTPTLGGAASVSQLDAPTGLAFDSSGDLVVSDSASGLVLAVAASSGTRFGQSFTAGDLYAIAGVPASGTTSTGNATSIALGAPTGLGTDLNDDVFVADSEHDQVYVVTEAGNLELVAGTGQQGDSPSGTSQEQAVDAQLSDPTGVAVDWAGDVFVTDTGNGVVREVDVAGDIATVAGDGVTGDLGDGGTATAAQLSDPGWLSLDTGGDLLVTDGGNNRIRMVVGAAAAGPEGGPCGGAETFGSGQAPDAACMAASEDALLGPDSGQVSTLSGDYSLNLPLVSIPNRGGPLAVSLSYNSQSATSSGPAGDGWSLSPLGSLTVAAATGDVAVVSSDGSAVTFVPQSSGAEPCPGGDAQDPAPPSPPAASTVYYCAPDRVEATLTQDTATHVFTEVVNRIVTNVFDRSGTVYELTTSSDLEGDTTTWAYNTKHEATSITDPGGRVVKITWTTTTPAEIATISDAFGDKFTLAYGGTGNACLTSVTEPGSRVVTLAYDTTNLLSSVLDPDAQTGGPDAGDATTIAYDSQDRVVSAKDPAGNTTAFVYTGVNTSLPGGTTTVTDGDGYRTLDVFHLGELVATTTGDGTRYAATTRFSFDPVTTLLSGVTDADGHATSYSYNANGDLLQRVDPLGRVTTYTYDALGDPLTLTDPEHNTTTSTYDADGDITSTTVPLYQGSVATTTYAYGNPSHPGDLTARTDPDGGVTSYTYDAYGNVLTTTDPMGGLTTETFDLDGRVLSSTNPVGDLTKTAYSAAGFVATRTDPLGGATKYTYDANGNRLTETDPLSRKTTWTYNADDLPTSTKNALGDLTTTTYDGDGRAVATTNPLGDKSTTTFDPAGLVLATTNPDGNTTTNTYDPQGNKVSSTNADGFTTKYTFDADNEMTRVVDPNNASQSYGYDADGEATTMTDGLGNVTTTVYDADGRKASVTAPDGEMTSYSYDGDNHQLTVTDALDLTTTSTYDKAGRLTSVTDPAGDETTYTYYADGKQETVVAPDGNTGVGVAADFTTTYTYDADGNQLKATTGSGTSARTITSTYDADDERLTTKSPLGEVSTTTYDAAGDVTSTKNPLGQVTSIAFDAAGHRTSITNPDKGVTKYAYDAAGRVTTVTDADGHVTSKTYDADGNVLTTTDGLGAVTTYTYDPAGQRATEKDPNGDLTTYTYDLDGDLVAVQNADNDTTTYSYDGDGHQVTSTDPLGRTTTYGYDADGRLVSTIDAAGGTTTESYDAAGRVSGVSYSDGTAAVSYGYDADGNRTQMTDGTGTTTYVYDPFGELTSETNSIGSTVASTYNANGERTGLTYPDGHAVAYAYDAAADVATVTDWLGDTTTYAYNGDGQVTLQTVGASGDKVTTKYDANDNQTWILLAGSTGTTLLSLANTYDKDGDLTKQVAAGALTGTSTYAYDAATRLVGQGTTTPAPTTLAYDPAGYITKLQTGATQTYDAAGQLQQQTPNAGSATAFVYDALGRRTSASGGTSASYGWNEAGVLASETTAGKTVSFAYDGDGLRMSASTGTATTEFTWDVTTPVPHLLSDGTNDYVYGVGDTPIEQIAVATSTPSYLVTDELGSVRAVVGITGLVTAAATYNAYGSVSKGGVAAETPFGYTGGETDTDGLVYMDHRYYDPATAQFISVDPLVSTTGAPYSYAGDDPANNTDPSGEMPCNGGGWCGYHMPVQTPQQIAATNQFDQTLVVQGELEHIKQEIRAQQLKDFKNITAIYLAEDNAQQLQAFQSSWEGTVSDICSGIGDSLTFGATGPLRNALISGLGRMNPVNEQSGYYQIGQDIGMAATFFVPGGAEVEAAQDAEKLGEAAEAAEAAGDLAKAITDAEHAASEETVAIEDTMSAEKDVDNALEENQQQLACLGGESFTSNTLVVLAGGGAVPISALHTGSVVRTVDPRSGAVSDETVRAVWVRHETGLLDLVISVHGHEAAIATTAGHLFYDLTTRRWTPAASLGRGDRLDAGGAAGAVVAGLVRVTGALDMWDITVQRNHDFLVELTIGPVLVHNASCPSPNGRNGGPAHQQVVASVREDMESRGLETDTELHVRITEGLKANRYADVVGYDAQGQVAEIAQVGRQTMGGLPVARERYALADILWKGDLGPGVRVDYYPYNTP